MGRDATTVGKWRWRFAARWLDGHYDEPRPGAPRKVGDERIAEIVARTQEETPPDGTHWSLRSMAREAAASIAALYVTGGTLSTKLALEFLALTAAQSGGRWRWRLEARSISTRACGGAPPST